MGQLTQIIPTTSGMLISAMDEPIKDLEDAILWQTAISNGCNWFVTENKKDFPLGSIVAVFSLKEIVEELEKIR